MDRSFGKRVTLHVGAGIVERVGKAVTKAQPSSRVILTFNSCNNCQQCKTHHPCYCQLFSPRNLAAGADVFTCTNSSSEGSPQACYGLFFGQSSFANLSIVQENSVIDVTDVVESEEELKLFAPMGCGFQAGAGTVTVLAGAGRESTVVVMGLGGVGLAAIMV
jgi:Zn-dependent alcohol dehydrogenase